MTFLKAKRVTHAHNPQHLPKPLQALRNSTAIDLSPIAAAPLLTVE
jgi:hypothetical protein